MREVWNKVLEYVAVAVVAAVFAWVASFFQPGWFQRLTGGVPRADHVTLAEAVAKLEASSLRFDAGKAKIPSSEPDQISKGTNVTFSKMPDGKTMFRTPPKVVVGISALDVKTGFVGMPPERVGLRVGVQVTDITTEGFTLTIVSWGPSSSVYGGECNWVAFDGWK